MSFSKEIDIGKGEIIVVHLELDYPYLLNNFDENFKDYLYDIVDQKFWTRRGHNEGFTDCHIVLRKK